MPPYPKYLDWLRYLCAALLFFYGLSKLTGHQLTTPAWVAQQPVGSLDGYTLTWYYFGYSHAYKAILGLLQIFSASLLLFRKSSLLAALLMLPVMVNVLLINLFYVISPGAERSAVFILVSLLLILWHQRDSFAHLLWQTQPTEPPTARKAHWIVRSLVLLYALGVLAAGTVGFGLFHSRAESYQQQHANVP